MSRTVSIWLLASVLSLAACGEASLEGEELIGADETQSVSDALTSGVSVGAVLQTTAPLNLRTGAGTGYAIRLTMPAGARCTVVNTGTPNGGWYSVKYGGTSGWAYGGYLRFYACPAGTYNLWNCNTTTGQLVRCVNGLVEQQSCSGGCEVKPVGYNDVCRASAPACPAGITNLWTCTSGGLSRCINGVVERQSCSSGCEVKPAGVNDVCKSAPSTRKVLPYTWQGQQTSYFCGPGSTAIALSTRLANPPGQWTLASYLGTTVYGTNHIGLVANALNHYLGTANSYYRTRNISDPATSAQRDLLRSDIATNIRDGYPLVANVVSGWRPPGYPSGTIYHYVAIVGYDSGTDEVLIADPAGACAAGSIFCNVPRSYWVSMSNLAYWIGGKGYAY